MAENSHISWCHHTFNPWHGCSKVSPACRFCYAQTLDHRWGRSSWGSKGERRMMSDNYWRQPLKWNRDAGRNGQRLRVFCASMADVFEDHPALPAPRARLWDLVAATPNLDWLLLTKRPQNATGMVPASWADGWPVNVWCGVSAETQRFAEERIPVLCGLPVRAVRFVSAAPQLGPVDFSRIHARSRQQPDMVYDVLNRRYGVPGAWQAPMAAGVDWIITEGESGAKARPSHPDWFRSVRDQCVASGVAFHHKQNGELAADLPLGPPESRNPDGTSTSWDRPPRWWVCAETGQYVRTETEVPSTGSWVAMYRVGLKNAGRLLDGELWDQVPTVHAAAVAP